jgi:hypothetical protein
MRQRPIPWPRYQPRPIHLARLYHPPHLIMHLQNHPLRPILPIQLLILTFHNREPLHNIIYIIALDTIQVKIRRFKLAAWGDFFQDKWWGLCIQL